MKKLILSLISILLLVSCAVSVYADSKSTTVRYSAPAIVTYKDYDGTSTTQKVDVGTILMEPKPKGKPDCVFLGWIDERTGQLWDFSKPVTEHLTLTASYSKAQNDKNANTAAKTESSPNTGDSARTALYTIAFLVSVAMLIYTIKRKTEDN